MRGCSNSPHNNFSLDEKRVMGLEAMSISRAFGVGVRSVEC